MTPDLHGEGRTIDARPGGMGDGVVALWIAEGARSVGDRIPFVDGVHPDLVRAFGHETTPEPTADCLALGSGTPACWDEFTTAPADATPRVVRWQRTVGWAYPALRPTLGPLGPEIEAWADGVLGDGVLGGGDDRPLVVIAPRASCEVRNLPLTKWLRAAWALEAAGIRTLAIDAHRGAVDRFPAYVHGFGWPYVLALLRRARVVAGNDSGIAQLATTLGVPTVVAMGPMSPEVVYGHCLDAVRFVQPDDVPCLGCHFAPGSPFGIACEHGCEALHRLDWPALRDAIRDAIETAIEPPGPVPTGRGGRG